MNILLVCAAGMSTNLLVNRINNGLSSFENELNSIPKEYRKQFIELYEKSKKIRND